ncbi:hypothetical protein [Shimia sp.]|uniref:hypothetical protein n=1 Tax=Shimia sp. TaxID=1954381 RepID=UPI003BA991C1
MTLAFLEHQPAEFHGPIMDALAREAVEFAVMLHFDFATYPVRISNRTVPFTDLEGQEWRAGGGMLVGMPDLSGGQGQLAPLREYSLGMPKDQMIEGDWRGELVELVSDVSEYRSRDYGLYGQIFTEGRPLGLPFAMDIGLMDRMNVQFGNGGAVATLGCEGLLARKGVPAYGMQTYFDQKRRHPTDEGFQFVTESGRLIVWTNW